MKRTFGWFWLVLCGLVLAKVWGPFHVSSIGPDHASLTLAQDREIEWAGANRIAQIYLAPVLNTPIAIARAIRDDYIRVVYYDGQIVDFKIKRWPSTIPIEFDKQVPSVDTPRLSASALADIRRRQTACMSGESGGGSAYTVSYTTGYWGSKVEDNPATGGVIITASWINTGTVSVSIRPPAVSFCP